MMDERTSERRRSIRERRQGGGRKEYANAWAEHAGLEVVVGVELDVPVGEEFRHRPVDFGDLVSWTWETLVTVASDQAVIGQYARALLFEQLLVERYGDRSYFVELGPKGLETFTQLYNRWGAEQSTAPLNSQKRELMELHAAHYDLKFKGMVVDGQTVTPDDVREVKRMRKMTYDALIEKSEALRQAKDRLRESQARETELLQQREAAAVERGRDNARINRLTDDLATANAVIDDLSALRYNKALIVQGPVEMAPGDTVSVHNDVLGTLYVVPVLFGGRAEADRFRDLVRKNA